MSAVSRFVLRHSGMVVLFWVVVAIVGAAAAGNAAGALSERFDLPGSESTQANQILAERFGTGGFADPIVAVVTLPPGTTVDSPGISAELSAALARVATAAPTVRVVSHALTGDRGLVSADGRTTFALIYPAPGEGEEAPAELPAVQDAVAGLTVGGAPIQITGIGALAEGAETAGGETSVLVETLIGAVGALVVLAWVFGSFLALVPLLIAGIAIVTCFLLVWGLTTVTDVSFIVQYLIALIGLGVAIDYSLLIVTRWREERAAGLDNRAAVQRAMETAGHAVVFSGITVAIGLCALVALPVPFVRSVGYGGMLIPLVSVAVSITLLPVVLAAIGPRLDWPRSRQGNQQSRAWTRWAAFVVRRRVLAALLSTTLLLALIWAAFSLTIGEPKADSLATGGPARAGLESLQAAGIGDGAMTPFEVVVDGGDSAAAAAAFRAVLGVRAALAPDGSGWRADGSSVVVVVPEADGNSGAGRQVLDRLRATASDLPAEMRIGGMAASNADFIDATYRNFPLMLALIVVVTFLILVRAFRSLLLPLKAVLLNVVSVGAAYGIVVLVWQRGWGSELIWGIEPTGAISAWVPLMAFSFLFGLSMDYEVFILARMREEYDRTGDTDTAVIRGIGYTARLVTAAALILFLAFVSLASIPETEVKIMATALAAGILLDATIVRAVLVPATVSLMGKWNWWLPAWLDRFAPAQTAIGRHGAGSASAPAD